MNSKTQGKSSPPKGEETRAPKKLKTPAEVRDEFLRRGESISAWARKHKFNAQLVSDIVNGNPRRKCRIGQSHKVAVLLGLKHGEIV